MNADDLDNLPKFIDGSGDSMWPVSPGRVPLQEDAIFVRLSDVAALLAKPVCQGKVEYVSVGMGSIALYQKAKRNGWTLFSYNIDNTMSGGWRGDSPHKCYYIKKMETKAVNGEWEFPPGG